MTALGYGRICYTGSHVFEIALGCFENGLASGCLLAHPCHLSGCCEARKDLAVLATRWRDGGAWLPLFSLSPEPGLRLGRPQEPVVRRGAQSEEYEEIQVGTRSEKGSCHTRIPDKSI